MSNPAESSDRKPRVQQSVPSPDPSKEMSDEEKRALEMSGEIEHQHGEQREGTAKKAEELQGGA